MTHPQEQNSEWIAHDGRGMPVAGHLLVDVMFTNGDVSDSMYACFWHSDVAGDSNWFVPEDGDVDGSRIIAYRLHTPSPSQGDAQ